MKYFVISDVHSFYDEMISALKKAGFDKKNRDHVLVSLGDLLDRGPDAIKCLKFINSLERKILIKGNHEDLIEQAIRRREFTYYDLRNGTVDTCNQINRSISLYESDEIVLDNVAKNKQLKKYLDSCIDYYEIGDYIFVHGWLPCYDKSGSPIDRIPRNWRASSYWPQARWLNGMQCWADGIKVNNKTVVCGHWHSSWGHSNLHNDGKEFLSKVETFYINPETHKTEPYVRHDPFVDKGIIAIDACTVISGIVNCLVLEI